MISPSQQRIVQIDITNACPHKCSNCTRFTSHVSKPYFMEQDFFKKAVSSMQGHPGMVGIMGGEPTLHPEFESMVSWYAAHWGPRSRSEKGRQAILDFPAYWKANLSCTDRKRGLWSSLGAGYAKHFELIQEVFDYQCLNDHRNGAIHQALLISRKDLGIPDAEWTRLRDACWVQNLWSSAITPKGAFFCEVAAALDMLFDGPGGWPVEPGWWLRTPDQFGEQLNWCEFCSAALQVPRRLATAEQDDVSQSNLARLEAIEAPSIRKKNRLVVFDGKGYNAADYVYSPDCDWYMPEEDKTRRAGDEFLKLRKLDGIIVSVDCADVLKYTLPWNRPHFDRLVVVTASHDKETQRLAQENDALLVISDECYANGDVFNKGRMLNAGLEKLEPKGWLLFTDADVFLPKQLRSELERYVLNPGCMYYTRRFNIQPTEVERFISDPTLIKRFPLKDPNTNAHFWGYFQLVHARSRAVKERNALKFPACFSSAASVDVWFAAQWEPEKKMLLPADGRRLDVVHIAHGTLGSRWNGNRKDALAWRYLSQSNVPGLGAARMYLELPCKIRATQVETAQVYETTYYGGKLPFRQLPGVVEYSYYGAELSFRPLPSVGGHSIQNAIKRQLLKAFPRTANVYKSLRRAIRRAA
jgi:hypothetical protein